MYWLSVSANTSVGTCTSSVTISSKFSAYGKLLVHPSSCLSPFTNSTGFVCQTPTCTAANCQFCGSSATACWKCSSGYVALGDPEGSCQLNSSSSSTSSSCSTGYALSETGERCAKCYSTCARCSAAYSPYQCLTCSGSQVVDSPPSYCTSACPTGKTANGDSVCITPTTDRFGGNLPAIESDDGHWYAGAIVIGIVSMLGFFTFVGYLIIKWPAKEEVSTGGTATAGLPQDGRSSFPPSAGVAREAPKAQE